MSMPEGGRRVLMGFGGVVVIAVACGGSTLGVETPVYKAGSRLRPIVVTNGVVKRFERFHDTALDMDCQFVTLSDGQLHCAPLADRSVGFADPQCTQRVASGVAPGLFLHGPDGDGPCQTLEVLETGEAVPLTTVYWPTDGTCTPAPAGDRTFSRIKRVVPPSELVGGTKHSVPRGPQLVMASIEADDGARQPFGIEDTDPYPGPCMPNLTHDGVLRCLPTSEAVASGYYEDARCSTQVGVRFGGPLRRCDPPPLVVATYHDCDWNRTFTEARGRRTGFLYLGGNGCSVVPASIFANEYFPIGKPIGDDSFAALRLVPGKQTPLALVTPKVDSGETFEAHTFWDSVHQTTCEPRPAADGTTRCAPVSAFTPFALGFADAQCTIPTVINWRGQCMQTPRFQAWLRSDANGRTTGEWRYYIIGPLAASSTVYEFSQGACVARDFSGSEVHTLQEITNELVELHEVTE